MKYYIFLGFVAVVTAYPGIIHDDAPQLEDKIDHPSFIGETGHQHHIEHEHAKSHQSIKFEHFHPVPVYVKKEHSHLLHHPLEKGKSEQNLKLIHPEHHHSHGGGLVLEDDRHDTEQYLASLGHGLEQGGLEQGGFEHLGGYEGYEGGEGLKEYAQLQAEPEGYYGQGDGAEGSYKYGSYY